MSGQNIHPDGYFINKVQPPQSLDTIKICKVDQIFQPNLKTSSSCACQGVSMVFERSLVQILSPAIIFGISSLI